jgi:hypothetical protein
VTIEVGDRTDSGEGSGPHFAKIIERFRPQAIYGNPTRRQVLMVVGLQTPGEDGGADVRPGWVAEGRAGFHPDHANLHGGRNQWSPIFNAPRPADVRPGWVAEGRAGFHPDHANLHGGRNQWSPIFNAPRPQALEGEPPAAAHDATVEKLQHAVEGRWHRVRQW